ncbi:MAG TPA: PLP-dependent aminotransferase family protein [bacterium]
MTSWLPSIDGRDGPIYMAIVASLAEDVAAGRLPEGSRLPTHRDLADALGVTVGTITRAYAEAHRRNLVSGEVGRGTFVKGPSDLASTGPLWRRAAFTDPNMVDLSTARATSPLTAETVSKMLQQIAADPALGGLLDYRLDAGIQAHREILAEWLNLRGVPADASQVVITSGAEHAINLAMHTIAHPGDTVLCATLTYPNVKYIAEGLHLKLHGLPMDAEGVIPAGFEQACKAGGVRALYIIPTLQNPTSAVLPLSRRQQIVDIARAHDVTIIEDNVFGFLEPDAPTTLITLAPERTIHVSSFSKLMAGGLRVGYVVAPPALAQRIGYNLHVNLIVVPPLMVELVTRLIVDGTAAKQIERQRADMAPMHARVAKIFAGLTVQTRATSSMAWLKLPHHWESEHFATIARQRGVLVSPAPHFHVGKGEPPNAVRIGLGGAKGERLDRALTTLADLARSAPPPAAPQDTLRIV